MKKIPWLVDFMYQNVFKSELMFLVIFLISFICRTSDYASQSKILKTNWRLQSSAKIEATGDQISLTTFDPKEWYTTSLPTTVLAALVDNHVYPDPYFGENLKSIPGYVDGRWLVMPEDSPFYPSWWYRTEFELDRNFENKCVILHLDGINYKANIWLNGHQIASSDSIVGMFRRFEFRVDDYIYFDQKNCLAVETIAPGKLPKKNYRTKQLEATTGWDDHNPQPPDMNLGIWQDVSITASGPLRIKYPYVAADVPSTGLAHLTISAQIVNTTKRTVTGDITGKIGEIEFSKTVTLTPNEKVWLKFTPDEFNQLSIAHPRLWWPHPVGPQELYRLQLVAAVDGEISDSTSVRFGVREITTYINEEGWRVYMVNGRKILIRGGAWMTSDMLLRLSHKRYDALIRYAQNAGLNMLRSEGFSIRETEDFYNLCDKYGIMVTQQIFGRSIPDEQLAIDCIEDMIFRIRNHPSLAHFLGHDETFPTPTLDEAYKKLIAKYTPERTYQPHSGAFEIENRWKTGGTRTGTRELWTYANPAHYYTHKEDGAWGFAQSGGIGGIVASLESIRRMMPEKDLWPLWTNAWSFHTVIQGGHYFDTLLKALEVRYGKPTNLEDFCLKAHLMNFESARGMYEAYGRNKYASSGITTWKYDAAWPAAMTWQYVDWFLLPTGAYYGAQKACEPLHVQYSYDNHSIYVVNNLYQAFSNLSVAAKIFNFDMSERYNQKTTVDIPADGKVKAFTIDWPTGLTPTHFLKLELHKGTDELVSQNFYWLSTVPDIEGDKGYEHGLFYVRPKSTADFTDLQSLPPVSLEVTANLNGRDEQNLVRVRIKNPSSSLAFFISLAITKNQGGLEVAPTFWRENDFSLLPGEEREITGTFYKRDLQGSSPILRVSGWNIKRVETELR